MDIDDNEQQLKLIELSTSTKTVDKILTTLFFIL